MAALTRFSVPWAVLAAVALGGPAARAQQPAPSSPAPQAPVAAPAGADAPALLAAAAAAFDQANFDKVRDLALQALAILEQRQAPAADPAEQRRLRARALDLAAQAYFNLGEKAPMLQTVDQLLTVDPNHRVDPAQTGAKFASFLEERRRKLAGRVVVSCSPLPCEEAVVDGEPFALGADGGTYALAGARAIIARRRNFTSRDMGTITVAAGAETSVTAALEQVARDVVLTTTPGGARVLVDGRDAGVTAPGSDPQGPSRPFSIPSLAPGPHVIVLQAACRRRLEQSVEVVLDAQNYQPLDLGQLNLEQARAFLDVAWNGPAGVLTLDGQPVEPGRRQVCPGAHDVSLAVGGRRIWFDSIEVKDEESRNVTPRPRPTAALLLGDVRLASLGLPGKAWNSALLEPAAAERLVAALAEGQTPQAIVPVYPAVARRAAPGIGALARTAAPEADVIFLILPAQGAVRNLNTLALVDARRDIVELTSWSDRDAKAAAPLAEELARPLNVSVVTSGFDVVERLARPPVVAAVLPDSPAAKAGLSAGQVLLALDGKPAGGEGAAVSQFESGLAPEKKIVVRVADPAGAERQLEFEPVVAAPCPNPSALAARPGLLLLPLLARASVARVAGTATERVAGGVWEGLGLAALGVDAEAAMALDRAVIDADLDLAQDARGTVGYVLERILRNLGRRDYADEVRARWALLEQARFGGRSGPPLRAALDAPED